MDVVLTDEQRALSEVTRELFAKLYPSARLREVFEGAEPDPGAWRAMAEVGIAGLTVPEEHGGAGGDESDLVLVMEEAGRACVPDPLLETVALGAPLLAEAGTEEQRERWLPAIAAGDARVTVKLVGWPYARDADRADLILVERTGAVHAVELGGIEARRVPTEDATRRLFELDLESAAGSALTGKPGALALAYDRAALASAAQLNGVSRRLLELTLDHVTSRHQFGQPIGAFQAIKHKLASVHVLLEAARAAVWYAAHAIAGDLPDRSVAASAAKVTAVEAGSLANTEALQCHAGIGFTWEHDLHLWLKRGRALEHAYGPAREHRERLAQRLFG